MGHEHHGLTVFLREPGQQIKHERGIFYVEITRRFVGQNNRRLIRERTGHRDALLLAARELRAQAMGFCAEADRGQQAMRPLGHLGETEAAEFAHGHHDVFQRRELEHQKVKLKHETDVLTPGRRARQVVRVRHFTAVDLDLAAIRLVQQAQQIKQRRFAATRRAHDRVDLTTARFERDAFEDVHAGVVLTQIAVQVIAAQRKISRVGHGIRRGLLGGAADDIAGLESGRTARRDQTRDHHHQRSRGDGLDVMPDIPRDDKGLGFENTANRQRHVRNA